MRVPALPTLTLLACLAGCTATEGRGPGYYERIVDLPPDLAAALTAGAVRLTLPFADPVPTSRGAPASPSGDGGFRIDYAAVGPADLVPVADARLAIDACTGEVVVTTLPADQRLPGPGGHPALRLRVVPNGNGTRVTGDLPPALAADLTHTLDRAFAAAAEPLAACAGCEEPNLAAFVASRLLAASRAKAATGALPAAQALLQRALRLGADAACLHYRLGELAASSGDRELAARAFAQAALRGSDPLLRARIGAARRALAVPEAASTEVLERLLAGDELAPAAAWLHTARRRHPEPVTDYRLLGELHARRADAFGALAAGLLAREHSSDPSSGPHLAGTLQTALLAAPGRAAIPAATPTAPGR